MPKPRKDRTAHNLLVAIVSLVIVVTTLTSGAGWSSLMGLMVFIFYEPDPMRDWHDAGGPDL